MLSPNQMKTYQDICPSDPLIRSNDIIQSIIDTAFACGFADQLQFTRVLKSIMNESPKKWRVRI